MFHFNPISSFIVICQTRLPDRPTDNAATICFPCTSQDMLRYVQAHSVLDEGYPHSIIPRKRFKLDSTTK